MLLFVLHCLYVGAYILGIFSYPDNFFWYSFLLILASVLTIIVASHFTNLPHEKRQKKYQANYEKARAEKTRKIFEDFEIK